LKASFVAITNDWQSNGLDLKRSLLKFFELTGYCENIFHLEEGVNFEEGDQIDLFIQISYDD
jgi:hypothetical protein